MKNYVVIIAVCLFQNKLCATSYRDRLEGQSFSITVLNTTQLPWYIYSRLHSQKLPATYAKKILPSQQESIEISCDASSDEGCRLDLVFDQMPTWVEWVTRNFLGEHKEVSLSLLETVLKRDEFLKKNFLVFITALNQKPWVISYSDMQKNFKTIIASRFINPLNVRLIQQNGVFLEQNQLRAGKPLVTNNEVNGTITAQIVESCHPQSQGGERIEKRFPDTSLYLPFVVHKKHAVFFEPGEQEGQLKHHHYYW